LNVGLQVVEIVCKAEIQSEHTARQIEDDFTQFQGLEAVQVVGAQIHLKAHAPIQGVHGQRAGLQAQGVAIKIHGCGGQELQKGQHFVAVAINIDRALLGLKEQATGSRYRINGIAHHL
jgi:hypothetical protein